MTQETTDQLNTASPALARFSIDPRGSRFAVQAYATGLLSKMGHNPVIGIRTFNGEVHFNPETGEAGDFRLTIEMVSLAVQDDISDKDRREIDSLMKGQVLEVARFPQAVYEAPTITVTRLGDALFTGVMEGSLNFHGVTNRQAVTVRIAAFADMLRASGDFTLRQSDYAVKPVSVAGGALKLKDELKFSFEMILRKHQ